MGTNLGRVADDRILSATDPGRGDVALPAPDLPGGDNLAAIRAADEWLAEASAWLSYYADAALRVGYESTSDLHRAQMDAIADVRTELRRMWLGNDANTPTIVDELRRMLDAMHYRVEQLLGGAPGRDFAAVPLDDEDESGDRPIRLGTGHDGQRPSESQDDYWRRVTTAEGKTIVRDLHADLGTDPPAWSVA